MFMICVQHVITKSGVEDIDISSNAYVYWFIDMFCCCAVDAYAMISGYVSNKKTIPYKRIINLWFQAIFYSFIVSLLMNLFYFKKTMSLSFLVKSLMPITNNTFWYITAYIPLLFLAPFLNRSLENMGERELKHLLIVMLFVFSFLALLGDSWSLYGYSCIWILILYVTGSIIRRIGLFKKTGSTLLLSLYLLSVAVSWISFYITRIPRMMEYISPTIVLCAMVLIVIFSRIPVQNKTISKISSLTLGIYLLQGNPLFSQFFFQSIIPLDGTKLFSALLLILAKSSLLMIIGFAVEKTRTMIFHFLKIGKVEDLLAKLLEAVVSKLQTVLDSFI